MVTTPAGSGQGKKGSTPRSHLEGLELALRAIEATGEALVSAPRSTFDLRPLARALERGATALLDAYDARREVGSAIDDATAACDEVSRGLSAASAVDGGLRPAIGWVETAAGWLRNAREGAASAPARKAVVREVMASGALPALHAIERPTLVPRYAVVPPVEPIVPPDPPPDPSLPIAERMALVREQAAARRAAAADRRAAAAEEREKERIPKRREVDPEVPGFVPGRYRAWTGEEVVVARARECFEEIAALGSMRIPLLGDPWRTSEILDRRMLTSIDAMAALGPRALGELERFIVDAPAKDSSRAFAVSMIGGCFEGRDALAMIERCLRFLGPEDDDIRRQALEGLSLVPHPALGHQLRRWLRDDDPGLRALAIGTLARRGEATLEELASALADDEPIVIEKALVPAALARVPELEGHVEALLAHSHEGMPGPLAWALVLAQVPFTTARLVEWLGSGREDAALAPLVMAGDLEDARRVVALCDARMTRPRLFALGWAGSPEAFPVLLRALREAKDDEVKLTAAFALDRITGARLYEDSLVMPEMLDVPEPDEPDDPVAGPPLARDKRVSDKRDLPSDGSPDRMQFPTIDPSRWEAWFDERAQDFTAEKRYRRGMPYTPGVSLAELDQQPLVAHERRMLHWELVLKTGDAHPFDPHGFTGAQEEQITAWGESANRASSQPGTWGRVRRR